jgi:hypothetical protein
MSARRFPLPWSVTEENAACFIVKDHARKSLAYVYFEDEPGRRASAKLLTRDEARRIAANREAARPDRHAMIVLRPLTAASHANRVAPMGRPISMRRPLAERCSWRALRRGQRACRSRPPTAASRLAPRISCDWSARQWQAPLVGKKLRTTPLKVGT